MEEHNQEEDAGNTSQWLQDNLRIIVSIVIVIAIAGGIYSYSKRSQETIISTDESTEEISLDDSALSESDQDAAQTDEAAATEEATYAEVVTEAEEVTSSEVVAETETVTEPAAAEEQVVAATSKETEGSFIETAGKGDGTTHLARRALANYLEKNPDSELKAEHKIYIEDYLRKKVGSQGLSIGNSVEFSKDLIREAIGKSKELNEAQLKNLHKYVVLVPSLS